MVVVKMDGDGEAWTCPFNKTGNNPQGQNDVRMKIFSKTLRFGSRNDAQISMSKMELYILILGLFLAVEVSQNLWLNNSHYSRLYRSNPLFLLCDLGGGSGASKYWIGNKINNI